jgi:glutamate synthase domain-containing protein 1
MIERRYDEKDMSGCAILGILNTNGERIGAEPIIRGIASMHDRSNGLGGGFAAYGIYPEHKDHYALHIMYTNAEVLDKTEKFLDENCFIDLKERIPHKHLPNIKNHPLLRRYFVKPKKIKEDTPNKIFEEMSDDEAIFRLIFKINSEFQGVLVFSSGKNMGIFKGVGYPEEIAEFYKLTDYKAHCWTAHGRFPTNSQAWWGGAHPFGLLDISVIHNGEISSYGINKRYLENFQYKCTVGTDTEVIAYLWDLFMRRQNLDYQTVSKILSAPFWSEIDRMPADQKKFYTDLRMIYSSGLLNGPFAIIVGFKDGMLGLNDRLKLRPLIAAKDNEYLYIASEESAIHEANQFQPLNEIWSPKGGDIVFGRIKNGSN